MEVKNDNPNGCDVVIKILYLKILFYFINIFKLELNKGLQSLF